MAQSDFPLYTSFFPTMVTLVPGRGGVPRGVGERSSYYCWPFYCKVASHPTRSPICMSMCSVALFCATELRPFTNVLLFLHNRHLHNQSNANTHYISEIGDK